VIIYRTQRTANFTIIGNDLIRDERISYRAAGLLINLLSRPSGWRTDYKQLARGESREGQRAVMTALQELETIGYLVRTRHQDEGGRWQWDYFVFDTPRAPGSPDEPGHPGEPAGQTTDQFPRDGYPSMETCTCKEVPVTKDRDEEVPGVESVEPRKLGTTSPRKPLPNWRTQDRAQFAEALGNPEAVTADGRKWTAGAHTVEAMYRALCNDPWAKKDWPGRYLAAVADGGGVREWLDGQGLDVEGGTLE